MRFILVKLRDGTQVRINTQHILGFAEVSEGTGDSQVSYREIWLVGETDVLQTNMKMDDLVKQTTQI